MGIMRLGKVPKMLVCIILFILYYYISDHLACCVSAPIFIGSLTGISVLCISLSLIIVRRRGSVRTLD